MAKTKVRKKKAPQKAAKRSSVKAALVVPRPAEAAIGSRRVTKAKAAEIRLPLTAPVRVVPARRPMSPARPMPMPVSVERPIAPIQLRQPSLFQRELPPYDGKK